MKARLAFAAAAAALLLCGVAALLPAAHARSGRPAARRAPVARPAPWPLWAHQAKVVAAADAGVAAEPQALSASGTTKLDAHGLQGSADRQAAVAAAPIERSDRLFLLLPRPDAASPGIPVPPPRIG
jgi:hypothetical protein